MLTTRKLEVLGKLCRPHCYLVSWYNTHIVCAISQINILTKDFVEEHATSKLGTHHDSSTNSLLLAGGNRANIATALYPILRTVFFRSSRLSRFGGGLSYTVNMPFFHSNSAKVLLTISDCSCTNFSLKPSQSNLSISISYVTQSFSEGQ